MPAVPGERGAVKGTAGVSHSYPGNAGMSNLRVGHMNPKTAMNVAPNLCR